MLRCRLQLNIPLVIVQISLRILSKVKKFYLDSYLFFFDDIHVYNMIRYYVNVLIQGIKNDLNFVYFIVIFICDICIKECYVTELKDKNSRQHCIKRPFICIKTLAYNYEMHSFG